MKKIRVLVTVAFAAAFGGIGVTPAVASGGYTITDLGTLGGTYSQATAISPNGTVVGYSSLSGSFPWHAFRYSGGMMTELGTLGGDDSEAYDVNDAGQVVGASTTATGLVRAFLVDGGSMMDLGTLGGPWSFAWGINSAAVVVGDADVTSGWVGFAVAAAALGCVGFVLTAAAGCAAAAFAGAVSARV
jgi:probable HAF family extracellular repeat protein